MTHFPQDIDFITEYTALGNLVQKVSKDISDDLLVDTTNLAPSEKCKLETLQLESKREVFREVFRRMENLLAMTKRHGDVYAALKVSTVLQQGVLTEMQKLGIIE